LPYAEAHVQARTLATSFLEIRENAEEAFDGIFNRACTIANKNEITIKNRDHLEAEKCSKEKNVAKARKFSKNVAIKCPLSVFKNTIFLISRCGIYISH
jgi:hypothetical protein